MPYAVVTGLRSGFSKPAQKWELLKRVTTENPRFDREQFSPLSFDHGFPLAYKHFYVYAQDERVSKIAMENGAIAAGVVLALFGALGVFLYANRRSTLHGDARFGTLPEARRAGLAAKCGIILGRLNGQTLVSDDPGHVLIVGPTRTGKGVSFVIPNGLAWRGSMVTLDIKSENLKSFGAARAAKGDGVFVFAPGSASSHRYNPLDYVRPGPELATDCANIASFLVATGAVENEWTLAARKTVAALLGYVMTSIHFQKARHIRSAVRVISTGHDIADVLKTIVATERDGAVPPWVLDALNQFVAIPDRTRGSVMFNVNNAFAPWDSPLICAATETSDFDIRDLRRKRMSIFIGSPLADLESYRPLIRILFQQIHDVLMRELPGADEPHQVLLLLDEFYTLGRMSSLASKIAVSAGYGFRMAIVLQNISQLDETYGKAMRETLVAGAALKLFVAINDNETAKYVSDALGTYTATHTTKMMGTGLSQSRVSLGHMAAPLRRPQELTRMPNDTSILLVANARPFEIRKVYFFRDLRMRQLVEQSSDRSIEPPSLRRWIESAAWLDTNLKKSLNVRAEGERPREEQAAIDAATSEAVAGICAEAQRLGRRSSSNVADDLGSALKDLSTIAEQIRKDWNVRSRG
ncbi:type IV secretory system conjugative DNA transfer family protein [Methylocystis echinoides]|uniref:type IV secretory system conjugative DNA transfer family protein n=1 Tax=Methylocystis echinoides TaxID=29468 RepID=UPI002491FAFE|nr:type IV secretory system conjugative DNA transfer family protein [Methylocystis echinoides]